jgi:HEPN domain-containing protein
MPNKIRAQKWLDIVKEDLNVAEDLYKTRHWLYVAFMCHQVIEKALTTKQLHAWILHEIEEKS